MKQKDRVTLGGEFLLRPSFGNVPSPIVQRVFLELIALAYVTNFLLYLCDMCELRLCSCLCLCRSVNQAKERCRTVQIMT